MTVIVDTTAVERGLLGISRRVTLRNIPIQELEINVMLQNAEISPVALLNSVSIKDAHPTISKILGTLTGNICSGASFSMVIDGRIGQVDLFIRNFV